jgi:superfamily I DNA/RNA helicase
MMSAAFIIGSPQQEAIWEFLRTSPQHGLIDAVAGSGKTFTIVEGIVRLGGSVDAVVMAFNKHIATEMVNRLRARGVDGRAQTYNSFGWGACLDALGRGLRLDDKKLPIIVDDLLLRQKLTDRQYRQAFGALQKLARLAKCYLLNWQDEGFRSAASNIIDRHDIDVNGTSSVLVLDLLPEVLRRCLAQRDVLDFDDQCWFPVMLGFSLRRCEMLLIDEAQDTNKMQQELAMLACPEGRIIVVGDRNQAIYGFRGADMNALGDMATRLEATERGCAHLPLTITRRCPKSHVRLAQSLVPQIEAMDDADEGEVEEIYSASPADEVEQAAAKMRPGDLAICRVNKALVPVCYALLRRGVKAQIRGRDIGAGLLLLVERLKADGVPLLLEKLGSYQQREERRIEAAGGSTAKLQALADKCDTLRELCDGARGLKDLRDRIERIFADFEDDGRPRDAVILGTIHRTKGLEAATIFILRPDLLPHPMARQKWEKQQEANLAYVACTRAKYGNGQPGGIVFCGPQPLIYGSPARAFEQAEQTRQEWEEARARTRTMRAGIV